VGPRRHDVRGCRSGVRRAPCIDDRHDACRTRRDGSRSEPSRVDRGWPRVHYRVRSGSRARVDRSLRRQDRDGAFTGREQGGPAALFRIRSGRHLSRGAPAGSRRALSGCDARGCGTPGLGDRQWSREGAVGSAAPESPGGRRIRLPPWVVHRQQLAIAAVGAHDHCLLSGDVACRGNGPPTDRCRRLSDGGYGRLVQGLRQQALDE